MALVATFKQHAGKYVLQGENNRWEINRYFSPLPEKIR